MNKSFFVIIMLTLALPFGGVGGSMLHAQGNDPVLAGMIALYTDKAKKELKQQEKMMLLEATGHTRRSMLPQTFRRSSTNTLMTFTAS